MALVLLVGAALTGCGNSTVSKSDIDAALSYMADRTTICSEKLKAVEISSTKVEGQSCQQNLCDVKAIATIRFTPAVSRISGVSGCGFDIGQFWTYPGFTGWLTKGAGNGLSADLLEQGVYKPGNTLNLNVELKFKKYATGWQLEKMNY